MPLLGEGAFEGADRTLNGSNNLGTIPVTSKHSQMVIQDLLDFANQSTMALMETRDSRMPLTAVPDNKNTVKLTLTSRGGGTFLLTMRNTDGTVDYIPVLIPLSAQPGDVLFCSSADVIIPNLTDAVNQLQLVADEITCEPISFGGPLGQIFRVLCVPVPECATGNSKRPLHVYFKTDNAIQEEYVMVPSDLVNQDLVNMAVPQENT